MVEAPYIAHIYVKDYYTNYTTISSWLADMKKMPLALDEIRIVPYGKDFEWKEPNFVQRILFGTQRFIYSFTEDYINNSSDNNKKLKLWVNWGRDQTIALDTLIRDSFGGFSRFAVAAFKNRPRELRNARCTIRLNSIFRL